MPIWLLGQNHRTAPIELRERLAFDDAKRERLGELLERDERLLEGVVVSTCNRMELYAVGPADRDARRRLEDLLQELHGVDLPAWRDTLYYHEDEDAVRHLFRVASGLDSMVLGEGQILAQVRSALEWSQEHRLSRTVLERAFVEAVRCGKRVRTDTEVSKGAVSVASAAVSLARKIFKSLQDETVLLMGAGDTGREVSRHLQLFGVRDLRVANRTRSRAEELAQQLDAAVVPWQNLSDHLSEAGIVVSAVSTREPVLTAAMAKEALRVGGRRAFFLIDLGVPRNIDPAAGKLAGVFLYNVDDLQGIVLEDADQRRLEAIKGERIVEEQVERFLQWYRARAITPTLSALRQSVEEIRQAELEAARSRLSPEAFAELERVTHRLMNKFLHAPTVGLKEQAAGGASPEFLRDFRKIFALEDESPRP